MVFPAADLVAHVRVVLAAPLGQRQRLWRGVLTEALRGLDQVSVARAAADVAIVILHGLLRGRLPTTAEQGIGVHDHAGSAKTALHAMVLGDALLHLVQTLPLRAHPLHGGHREPVAAHQRLQATIDRAVQPARRGNVILLNSHYTGAAAALQAAPLCAAEPLRVSQILNQHLARVGVGHLNLFAIEVELKHRASSRWRECHASKLKIQM
mmetsp:Transcript_13294/g.31546  ORF Transcript_13294/g.31546 Transcript_13294/m.31546 type:complete len:210 (+) Transcript_13294:3461-4090(+)